MAVSWAADSCLAQDIPTGYWTICEDWKETLQETFSLKPHAFSVY